MASGEFSRSEIIELIETNYQNVEDKGNVYDLGVLIGKTKGKQFVRRVQNALGIFKPTASDILLELYHPTIDEEHEYYEATSDHCFSNFVSGLVRGCT